MQHAEGHATVAVLPGTEAAAGGAWALDAALGSWPSVVGNLQFYIFNKISNLVVCPGYPVLFLVIITVTKKPQRQATSVLRQKAREWLPSARGVGSRAIR